MSNDKQTISRHKTATTRSPAGEPQHFDIIPAGKVRPSASGRPVITQTAPAVADDMLKSDTPAPVLNLAHATPSLDPPKATPHPEEKGVLLSDLVAKREKVSSEPDADLPAEEPVAEPKPSPDPEMPTAQSDGTPEDDPVPAKDADDADNKQPEPPTDDSFDAVMKREEGTPQKHSAALEDAMEEMTGKDGRQHHELYGGKPVIVVHKKHPMSAITWLIWFIVCVGLALLIVNFLLDAGVITTDYIIPHTNLL